MSNVGEILKSDSYTVSLTFKDGRKELTNKRELQKMWFTRLKKLRVSSSMKIYVNLSVGTESVYGMVSFKRKNGVFLFCIKNHLSSSVGVSKTYLYRDYDSIEHILEQIKRDINLARYRSAFCVDAQLDMVEYEVIKSLAETDCVLGVSTNNGRVNKYWFERNGLKCDDYKVKCLNAYMINHLMSRKMLIEKSNSSKISNLVVSKLGYLALSRAKHLYDADLKFNSKDAILA